MLSASLYIWLTSNIYFYAPVFCELHWLPVRQRLKFKTAVLVFKCLHGLPLAYLADYCQPTTVTAGRTRLQSAHTRQLAVPRTNTSCGDRSFAVSWPSMWNSLPAAVRSSYYTVTTFRTQLKTLLFVWLSDCVLTDELLPDSALVALRQFCAIQMAVIIIIIIKGTFVLLRLRVLVTFCWRKRRGI